MGTPPQSPVLGHAGRSRRRASDAADPRPLSEAAQRDAALAYLGRYAATRAGLARVLNRRIDRWLRMAQADGMSAEDSAAHAAPARAAIGRIVANLAQAGAVDDTGFAAARAGSLARAGRSARAIGAHLAAKGVPAELVAASRPADEAAEFAAAVIHARRRRLGAFGGDVADAARRRRDLASMARAGFSHDVAARALAVPTDEAEALIRRFREG